MVYVTNIFFTMLRTKIKIHIKTTILEVITRVGSFCLFLTTRQCFFKSKKVIEILENVL